jgi:hypothetical protein
MLEVTEPRLLNIEKFCNIFCIYGFKLITFDNPYTSGDPFKCYFCDNLSISIFSISNLIIPSKEYACCTDCELSIQEIGYTRVETFTEKTDTYTRNKIRFDHLKITNKFLSPLFCEKIALIRLLTDIADVNNFISLLIYSLVD